MFKTVRLVRFIIQFIYMYSDRTDLKKMHYIVINNKA